MKVVVLGAGVMGVTTAYFLAKNGHEVTVIDRGDGCARECSFANGGQLSYSHAEPWANPTVIQNLIKWVGKEDAPLVLRLQSDYNFWKWGIKFLLASTQKKSHDTTRKILRLSLYSQKVLHALHQDHPVSFNYTKRGILHIFRNQQSLDREIKQAQFQKEFGCDSNILNREECMTLEPALRQGNQPLVGGVFFPGDEGGDAHIFTDKLAKICETELGVKFLYNTEITTIVAENDKVTAVHTNKGTYTADSYVMALGASSPLYSKKIGISLPIYPMKGYSISIPVVDEEVCPNVGITDQTYKVVYTRLGDVIRVAGTAEFAGYNYDVSKRRIALILEATKHLFPSLVTEKNSSSVTEWACLRPSTPTGIPLIGKTYYSNLFLNTGHGTLGWTLACGSARIIADIIEGKKPEIDTSDFCS